MNNRKRSGLARRDFVKIMGVGAGAMMVNPTLGLPDRVLAENDANPLHPTKLKIGLLLPSSNIRPGMTSQLMNGMQLYFDQTKSEFGRVQLIPESIGPGSTVALRKATQLLKEADVDLVVGMVSTPTALHLRPLFESEQKVLLVVGAGETRLRPHESSPYIFHSTLNYWQSNWAAGQWAAQHKGNRAFMLSSFYESGYDAFYAFQNGFEQAGGTIVGRAVTHISPDNDGMANAMAALQAAQPDVVFAAYSGKPTQDFLRNFASLGLDTTLIGTSFMAGDQTPLDMYVGTSWLANLNNAQNEAFSTDYRRMVGHTPDAFACLGYETAQLLTQSIQAGGSLANKFDAVHVNGPRGLLTMNHQSLVGPTYLAHIQAGQSDMRVLNHFPALVTDMAHTTEPRTGWINPYLV